MLVKDKDSALSKLLSDFNRYSIDQDEDYANPEGQNALSELLKKSKKNRERTSPLVSKASLSLPPRAPSHDFGMTESEHSELMKLHAQLPGSDPFSISSLSRQLSLMISSESGLETQRKVKKLETQLAMVQIDAQEDLVKAVHETEIKYKLLMDRMARDHALETSHLSTLSQDDVDSKISQALALQSRDHESKLRQLGVVQETQLSEWKKKYEESEEKLVGMKQTLFKVSEEHQELNDSLSHSLANAQSSLTSQSASWQKERESLQQELTMWQNAVGELEAAVSSFEKDLQVKDDELEKLKGDHGSLAQDFETIQGELDQTNEVLSVYKSNESKFNEAQASLQAKEESLASFEAALAEKARECQTSFEASREIQSESLDNLQVIQSLLQDSETDLIRARESIHSYSIQVLDLEKTIRNQDSQISALILKSLSPDQGLLTLLQSKDIKIQKHQKQVMENMVQITSLNRQLQLKSEETQDLHARLTSESRSTEDFARLESLLVELRTSRASLLKQLDDIHPPLFD